jgi:hypothetical protein
MLAVGSLSFKELWSELPKKPKACPGWIWAVNRDILIYICKRYCVSTHARLRWLG